MKHTLIGGVIVAALIMSGCHTSAVRKTVLVPAKPAGTIRVMTYNINWGMWRPENCAEAIRLGDADIVLLQETNFEWEFFLNREFSRKYPYRKFHHEFGGAGGMGIMSKYPFREQAFFTPKGGWFPGWAVLSDTPLGKIQFLNVHLHPPLNEEGSVGCGKAIYTTKAIRLNEIATLAAKLKPGIPTVICGDFNEDDGGRALRWLEKHSYRDALPGFDKKSPTWNWKTSYFTVTGRYDHIFFSKQIKCLYAQVVYRGASDHFPVIADLKIF